MIKRAIILIVGIAVVMAGRWFFFHGGSYSPPPPGALDYRQIAVAAPPAGKFAESGRVGAGTLLVDRSHGNLFSTDDLSVLLERVLSRGYVIQYLDTGEKEKTEKDREAALRARLPSADAFAVVLPRTGFSLAEIVLVSDFVDRGGKLILIGDPARPSTINSVASQFGMTFQADYLYNQKENEGNFRNIFVGEFKESSLTSGLQRVVFYSASSISPSDMGLAFVDADTVSNLIESKERLSPMLVSENNRVLAISDITLMGEPYNSTYDNNRLIANIADWLTLSERAFLLADFPYFFRGKVTVEASEPRFVDMALKVKSVLDGYGKTCEVGRFPGKGERVYLGLFSQADNVSAVLSAGGISVATPKDKPVSVEVMGVGQVYRAETALLYLNYGDNSRSLILLADAETGLQRLVDGLSKGDFRQWLVRDDLALSYLKKPETPTPTPRLTQTPAPSPKPTEKPRETVKP